jgi:hypothetical protein
MDKIYYVSLIALVGADPSISANEIATWENVSFKVFLILVIIALACYQIYRDRQDRSRVDLHHIELRADLKTISDRLHAAELDHTQIRELTEQQLNESRQIRTENAETFRRQWDLFAKEKS